MERELIICYFPYIIHEDVKENEISNATPRISVRVRVRTQDIFTTKAMAQATLG